MSSPSRLGENQLQLNPTDEDKKQWLDHMMNCLVNLLSGVGTRRETGSSWEIPFADITDLRYLGAGGQGVVFQGCYNGEIVAVKKVGTKNDTDLTYLRKLKHNNIVRFIGVCPELPYFCILMEFCQYGSLYDFLRSGTKLLPSQTMQWARDIALGMDYLHSNGVIHRDLKSPNVLIGDDMVAKICDFETIREFTKESEIMTFTGTVAWMPPEIIRHEPCSEKVDVWSFGVVLWEMFTREIPYRNLEAHAIMWGIGTGGLSLPIPKSCPNALQILVSHCWKRVPKERPSFKVIVSHLEKATAEIIDMGAAIFAASQDTWGAEVREMVIKIYEKARASCDLMMSLPGMDSQMRMDLLKVKEAYERQIVRANELYMEVCSMRLQLETRERVCAERERLLLACRCLEVAVKLQRHLSSTSENYRPVSKLQPRKKKQSQLLVNYVEKKDGRTYTVAVDGETAGAGIESTYPNTKIDKKQKRVQGNGKPGSKVHAVPVHTAPAPTNTYFFNKSDRKQSRGDDNVFVGKKVQLETVQLASSSKRTFFCNEIEKKETCVEGNGNVRTKVQLVPVHKRTISKGKGIPDIAHV